MRNLQTFAPVHERKEFLLENYSEIRKYRVVPVLYETEQFANAVILYEHFPESPWVSPAKFIVFT